GSNGRKPFARVRSFLVRERSIGVLLAALVALALGALALRLFLFPKWFLWFWSVAALTAFLLLFIASVDFVADVTGRRWHWVTDQQAPWGPWVQRLLVPVMLVAGILFDHLVA